ncbi:L7Ae/L30e/S12e/Gadd45 family ribosomal protein [Hutsoniella sourekii]|uniref:L7Ae/L30e/S12e/Gadd45 family ribosomal protein n=1 Tax=Hutsoniella sourekii TaxID=87650 RepID=UPI00047FE4F9|nr:ribosomal L7Ae/L30e/S12e/Gadd45 family protein [Hutsoniella sourekii]
MSPKQKQLNLLGLAQRAGYLVTGDELVEKASKTGQVVLIVCASDASDKTKKRYQDLSEYWQIPVSFAFNRLEISQALGKKRTLCGLKNRGMAKKFLSYESGEVYDS